MGRSKSPTTNPMTAMLAVNKFKSAGINQSGQRHKNGSSGRRTAENKLIPPQHPSTGQNDACSLLLLFLVHIGLIIKCFGYNRIIRIYVAKNL